MKKTKLLALLLALAMVFCLAACGGSEAPAASEAASAEASAPEASAPEASAPEAPAEEPEAPAAPAEDVVMADSSVEGNDGATVAVTVADPFEAMAQDYITYPLEGENTITMWYYIPGYQEFMDSNYNFNALPAAEAATGVKLEFVEVSDQTAREQFNMMVAGGDYPDLLPVMEYYTNGLTQAYEDEVIVDIGQYIDEYMPNYAAVLETLAPQTVDSTLTDGATLAFYQIKDGTYSGNGFVSRQDWIDEQNWEWSGDVVSTEEFTEYLRTMKNAYDVPNMIYMTDGTVTGLEAAFDTAIPALKGDGFMTSVSTNIMRYDEEVTSAWITDNYRAYLEWVLQMMDEGIIYRNYLDLDADRMVQNTKQASGEIGIWNSNADKIDEVATNFEHTTDAFALAPLPRVAEDPAAQYVWNDEVALVSNRAGFSLSSTCENPEIVCQWENYWWTTDGYYMANYGVEGESYHMDGDTPVFDWSQPVTITGRNAPNAEMAQQLFTMLRFAGMYADNDMLLSTFSETALKAVSLWTIEGSTDARHYPSTLSNSRMTVEETEEINSLQGDILTFAPTEIMKFLDGSAELNDETWGAFVDEMNNMGLDRIIEIYQIAYDEYVAGER